TGRTVVVDARHAVAQFLLIRVTFGCQRLYLAPAARHTRSDLFEDVTFDGRSGQRLRRTGVPTLALGGGASVIAITAIAAANLGRRHGAAARPAKEQALQQCLGRCAFRSCPPRKPSWPGSR